MEPWISVSTTQDATHADGIEGAARFEAVRLDGFAGGARFGVWWLPVEREAHGSVLCVQPLGDEHAQARHAIAAQAWRLAALGWAVLVTDLYGCGDSPGDPAQATLDGWRNDLLRAAMLARQRAHGPNVLWGVRAGALLGVDIAVALDQLIDAHLFWQAPEAGRQVADALRSSAGLSSHMLTAIEDLRMQPPPTAERGNPPAVLFIEANESPSSLGDVSPETRTLTENWLEAGYLANARAARTTAYWDPAQAMQPLPYAMFDATEEFLESIH